MHYHLAQVNVARMVAALDSPELASFVAQLDAVNAEADRAPGFVWRLLDASSVRTEADLRFEQEALQANLALVDLVGKVAERKQATVGQVALAWLLAQKPWIVPIPGTRRLGRLEENLGAADLDLTTDDLAELDSASTNVQVVGDRYPEAMQKMIDR